MADSRKNVLDVTYASTVLQEDVFVPKTAVDGANCRLSTTLSTENETTGSEDDRATASKNRVCTMDAVQTDLGYQGMKMD